MSINKLVSALSVILLLASTFAMAQAERPRVSGALSAESLDGKLSIHLTFTNAAGINGTVRLKSDLPDGTKILIFSPDAFSFSFSGGILNNLAYRNAKRTISDVLGNTTTDTGVLIFNFLLPQGLCCGTPVITRATYIFNNRGFDAATGDASQSTDYTTLVVTSHFRLIRGL